MTEGIDSSMLPLREVVRVTADRLALDWRNPRLIGLDPETSDHTIIAQLYRDEDLSELLQSIAANGYLDIEPLVVVEERKGVLTVLEGNRRLAALRLFRDTDLATRVREECGVRVVVPEMPAEHRQTLEGVSVYRVARREDSWSFIGFKHINGAARWESYAKAKFAADWYRKDNISLADIARRIGDKHDTIKRMVNAIYVLEQAQQEGVFSIEDRVAPRFSFSHLYTALSRAPYMDFLGLEAAWSRFDPTPDPIPKDNIEQLAKVFQWIYGSKSEGVEPIIQSQNPDIKLLAEVLGSKEALMVLRQTGSLTNAHASTQSVARKFEEALLRARDEIRKASNNLRGFDGQDGTLVEIAGDVSEIAQTVHQRLMKRVRDVVVAEE
ncbi:MAG: ParB/Srx family N-terminal domain-containing protein [Gammaproteobacteria bacterium]|nr:ParB/Srx family N-terminal domain-containing protein [Gammaproteobacteria bacterium]